MSTGSSRGQLAGAALALTAVATWMFRDVLGCASSCLVDMREVYDPSHPLYLLYAADTLLNSWALGWIHHALLTPGAGVFQGNAFYPAAYALTGSEHMLGVALPLLPISVLGVNAVRIHQLALFGSFLGTALATLALVRRLTGSTGVALVAGLAALAMPWRMTELSHVQLEATPWMVLSWLFLARAFDASARPRDFVLLALALAAALLSSYYLAWFTLASVAVLAAVLGFGRNANVRAVAGVALAACAALAALAAVTWPYLHAHGLEILDSSAPVTAGLAGAWRSIAPDLAHRGLVAGGSDYRLPLSVATLAAATPLLLLRHHPDERQRIAGRFALALVIACAIAFVLSGGNDTRIGETIVPLPGRWLTEWLPGYAAMRAAPRWAILIGVAAPIAAALSAYALIEQVRYRGYLQSLASNVALLAIASIVVVCDAPLRTIPVAAPLPWMQAGNALHETYAALRGLPEGPVIEVPAPGRSDWEAQYMHASTLHWFPTIHGYTRYEPPLQQLLLRVARDLPSRAAVDDLRRLVGARWIVVHWPRLSPGDRTAWEMQAMTAGLVPVRGSEVASIYEIPEAPDGARWLDALRDLQPRATTLTGLPRAPLERASVAGALTVTGPDRAWQDPQGRVRIELLLHIANLGTSAWASLDTQREGLVAVRITPVDQAGRRLEPRYELLGRDVAAGERLTTVALLQDRLPVGRYTLEVDLAQLGADDHATGLPVAPAGVEVEVLRGD